MQEKRYEINGKTYIQRPLVLGQVRQLMAVMKDVAVPADASPFGLIEALGDKLPGALAVVLTEEGKSPGDKDLVRTAAEIEFGAMPDTILDVIDSFFALNPIVSLLNRIGNLAETIGASVTKGEATSSRSSASSSQAETGPGATPSSGGPH